MQWLHSFQCWNNVLRICGARKKTVDDFLKVLQLYLIVFIITVICFAEEYKEHNVMVLRPIDLDETCVLIVEKSADTDLWHDVEDDTVRSEILQKYMENNRPDCMEVVE